MREPPLQRCPVCNRVTGAGWTRRYCRDHDPARDPGLADRAHRNAEARKAAARQADQDAR